jgi:cyclophilin family peptidyl-prolyl cis-trans isomerase
MKHLLLSLLFATAALAGDPVVVMKTNLGDIKIQMNPEKAPKTVENFLKYVRDGFYTNTVYHRVIKGFVVQGGGFARAANKQHEQKKVNAPVQNEASNGLSNTLGTISMARTRDPHSATSQFFLNVADNSGKLDPSPTRDPNGYAVFGKIIEGMDVLKKMEETTTGNTELKARMGSETGLMMMTDVPVEDLVLMEAYVDGEKKPTDKQADPAKPEEKK